MIEFLKSIWTIIYDSVINIINLIIQIPQFYNSFKNIAGNIDILGGTTVLAIVTVIISIGILIKIKRLVF